MALINTNSIVPAISQALKTVERQIVGVKTASVVSDLAVPAQTVVTLDDDPFQIPIVAISLAGRLAVGSRVMLMSFPPQGILILGSLTEPVPFSSTQLVFSSNSTITAANAAGATAILLETLAGGAGGGGTAAAAASQSAAGSGGGSGGYAKTIVSVAGRTFPLQVNIGAAGAANSAADGGVGGNTSVIDNNGAGATLCAASGGSAGRVGSSSATIQAIFSGGVGGIGTTGTLLARGGPGGPSFRISTVQAIAGDGGSNLWGGGGVPPNSTNTAGGGGLGPGAGGSGSRGSNGGGAQAGGAGVEGRVAATFLYGQE